MDTWRISLENFQEYGQIENFHTSCHDMWLQEKKDTTKEWLHMKYYVMTQKIHMEVQDYLEEWKVPDIPRETPTVQV
jgi:hypothetical protein